MKTPQQSAVDEVITSRYSCRAFLPAPVPRETIAEILEVAARAPSGTNIQPWKAWVLTGETKARVSERLLAAFEVAKANGEGAVAFEGSMVDLPIVIRAERLLARAASWTKTG